MTGGTKHCVGERAFIPRVIIATAIDKERRRDQGVADFGALYVSLDTRLGTLVGLPRHEVRVFAAIDGLNQSMMSGTNIVVRDQPVRGIALSFVNYLDEVPYFRDEVLPRLVRLGVRSGTPAPHFS